MATYLRIYVSLLFIVGCVFHFSCSSSKGVQPNREFSQSQDTTKTNQEIRKYLSFGLEYYKNKQYEDAMRNFRKVLELDPENETAYKYLSDACLRHPDTTYVDTALALYQNARIKFPNNPYFCEGLGFIYLKLSRDFYELASKTPDSIESAKLQMSGDEAEIKALEEFHVAVKLGTKELTTAKAIASIWLRRVVLDSAMVWYEKAVELDSNAVDAWKILSRIYMARGKNQEATIAFRNLTRLEPDEPENLLRLGQYLAKTGSFDEAVGILQRYIDANPNDYRGFQFMGLALSANNRYDDALKNLKKAEQIKSDSPKLMCDIASVYKDMKNYTSAISYLEKAKRIDSKYGYIYIVEGELIQQQAMDMVPPSGELNMEIKCKLLEAYKKFQKALRDTDWSGFAKTKLDYLKSYIPTSEEIKSYKFMTNKECAGE